MIRRPPRSTLSLHDALPIFEIHQDRLRGGTGSQECKKEDRCDPRGGVHGQTPDVSKGRTTGSQRSDRKSTRLNSSHANISYAVFCLKKKKQPSCLEGSLAHR